MTTSPQTPLFPQDRVDLRHPANGETTLYLVRHGRTQSNVRQLLHGSTDVPLDAFGIRQAHSIAERLAREIRADVLLSSPLDRALTTAQIIGDRLGLEPVLVPGLVEMDFGKLEGATIESILNDHPELAARMSDPNDGDDLTWPEGESRRGFHARVLTTFESILSDYRRHSVVVVAHGGVIGSFLAQIHDLSPNDWSTYQLANCGLTHLDVTPEHTLVHLFNDIVHLEVLGDDAAESTDP